MQKGTTRSWLTRHDARLNRRSRPSLEPLEPRLAPATITVTTTADDITPNDGSVSLREAITAINAGNNLGDPDIIAQNPGTFGTNDAIHFNIPGSAPFQINVGSSASALGLALPQIVQPVVIDATTETGFSGFPLVVVNGHNAAINANGFDIELGSQPLSAGVTIKGFVINQFTGNGIQIGADNVSGFATTDNTITDNYIGTNVTGNVSLGNQLNGIFINAMNSNNAGLAASNNVISNNVIAGNQNDGVLIQAQNGVAAGNTLTGNLIGVNILQSNPSGPSGTFALANSGDGVAIVGASGNNIGTASGARNTISANQGDGIRISGTLSNPATVNIVANNFIGTDVTGKIVLGNQFAGIEVSGGNNNSIGDNVIGGNADGIAIDNGAQNNVIQGNFIGVGVDGTTAIGNKLHGIALHSDGVAPPLGPGQLNEPGVQNNLIGGTGDLGGSGFGNTIAFNGSAGVAVFANPVAISGQGNTGNTIEGNAIFQNGRANPSVDVGIDLVAQSAYPNDDGVTPNDSQGHAATSPNRFQNFPVLNTLTLTAGGVEITGTVSSSAGPLGALRLEFFVSDADPAKAAPEGRLFIGSVNTVANGTNTASFDVTLNSLIGPTQVITATATDAVGNTSEFSAGITAPNANQFFFLAQVYFDLLLRGVDTAAAPWLTQLTNGVPRDTVVLHIETDPGQEYYRVVAHSFYVGYLGRTPGAPDQPTLISMANFLATGGTIEQLRAIFTSSPEFFQFEGGGTANGFVNALYLDAFGTPNRVATDPGAAAYANALSQGKLTRAQISTIIFNSDEFHFNLVQGYYQQFLHRAGAASEINSWTPLLKAGVADQVVIADIAGSPEAFAHAQRSTVLPAPALHAPRSISPDLYGPLFSNTPLNGRPNLTGLYTFRDPADSANAFNFGNTVLIATLSPFTGALTPTSFDPRVTLDLNVVNTSGHLNPDFTFRVTFAPPTPAGNTFNQVVTVRLIQGNTTTTISQYTYVGNQVIPPAAFANNITFPGDAVATGKFIAGAFDDPSFLDAQGLAQVVAGPFNPFPRPLPANAASPLPTDAKNFYRNANVLAIELEVPTTKLTTANPPLIGVWADSAVNGTQVQRLGRPLVDALLIPPVPRSDLTRGDRRTAFNQGSPATDVANFRSDMIAVLMALDFFYQQSPNAAAALVDSAFGATILGAQTGLLPDILTVDLSKAYGDATSGFPNGRRLRDDVFDTLFPLLTSPKIKTDNVADDNGAVITDGMSGSLVQFPYIGRSNNPPAAGNP